MTTSFNPWTVNSVLDFWFLNCPEYTFHTKEEDFFQTHAVINHPASSVLFGNSEKEHNIDDSIDEYKETNHDYVEAYENQTPTEFLDVHSGQKCFIRLACLWSKMPMLQRAGMRKGGEPLPLAFQHLILMI